MTPQMPKAPSAMKLPSMAKPSGLSVLKPYKKRPLNPRRLLAQKMAGFAQKGAFKLGGAAVKPIKPMGM
jgi:hypothetical protein